MPKLLICIFIGVLVYLFPAPVNPQAWGLFSIFIGTIAGIILRPYPMGAVTLMGLVATIVTGILDVKTQALLGFSSSIIWLVVLIFFLARGFIKTKLGLRLAYCFVYLLGKNTITLGYGITLSEFLIAPFIPSNTARAGGIMLPIVKSISEVLGSTPDKNSTLGRYFMLVSFQTNIVTSALFLTSCAVNPIAQKFALDQGIYITWSSWFLGAAAPGLISLLLIPILVFFLARPQQSSGTAAQNFAKNELKKLGPISSKEALLLCIFGLMLGLWIFEGWFKINVTAVALLGVGLSLIFNIITLDDILSEREAWHTLLWLSILVTMATFLQQFGFISWFSQTLAGFTKGLSGMQTLAALSLMYFYSHYFFAGNTAHMTSMYSAFVAVSIASGSPPVLTALLFGYFSSLYSSMTHYGTASAPMFFGQRYCGLTTWWRVGFIFSVINLIIWFGVGSVWWKALGFY